MWNLGYMHEYGLGIHQDMFLAKRFYDSCTSADKDGYIVGSMSLVRWWIHYYWSYFMHGGVHKDDSHTMAATSSSVPASAKTILPTSGQTVDSEESDNDSDNDDYVLNTINVLGYDVILEDVLIALCAIVIVVIIFGYSGR